MIVISINVQIIVGKNKGLNLRTNKSSKTKGRKDKKSRNKNAEWNKEMKNRMNKKKKGNDYEEDDTAKGRKSSRQNAESGKERKNKTNKKKRGKKGKSRGGKCPLDKISRSLKRIEKLSKRLEDDGLSDKSRSRIEDQLEDLGKCFETLQKKLKSIPKCP